MKKTKKKTMQKIARKFAKKRGYNDLAESLPAKKKHLPRSQRLRKILDPNANEELYEILKSLPFTQQVESYDLNMADFRRLSALKQVLKEDPVLATKWTALVIARIGELHDMLQITTKSGSDDIKDLIWESKRFFRYH